MFSRKGIAFCGYKIFQENFSFSVYPLFKMLRSKQCMLKMHVSVGFMFVRSNGRNLRTSLLVPDLVYFILDLVSVHPKPSL
jgi:hypothetical protein